MTEAEKELICSLGDLIRQREQHLIQGFSNETSQSLEEIEEEIKKIETQLGFED